MNEDSEQEAKNPQKDLSFKYLINIFLVYLPFIALFIFLFIFHYFLPYKRFFSCTYRKMVDNSLCYDDFSICTFTL